MYYKRLALVAFLVIAIDQLSKWLLVDLMLTNDSAAIKVFEFFNLVMVWNRGVSFGILSSVDARIPLIIMSFIVVFCLTWWHKNSLKKTCAAGVGLVAGGALGNVIDRLHYGAVADFFDFYAFGHHWPAFNVADMSIVIGVCLLIIHEFQQKSSSSVATEQSI